MIYNNINYNAWAYNLVTSHAMQVTRFLNNYILYISVLSIFLFVHFCALSGWLLFFHFCTFSWLWLLFLRDWLVHQFFCLIIYFSHFLFNILTRNSRVFPSRFIFLLLFCILNPILHSFDLVEHNLSLFRCNMLVLFILN